MSKITEFIIKSESKYDSEGETNTGEESQHSNDSGAKETKERQVYINIDLIKNFVKARGNKKYKIITILGRSRNGKSAFLNCLATIMENKNVHEFKSMSSKESKSCDVTTGLNGYISCDKYLLIDVQGIGGEYSDADPLVILYCYLISDVIILNVDKRLDTGALKMLTPIAAKLNEMTKASIDNKPLLLFRIVDCDDDYADLAESNYKKMMESRKDEVESVRQAIKDLFLGSKKIIDNIVWTESPDKESKKYIDSGNTSKFMNNNETFINACNKINKIIVNLDKNSGRTLDTLITNAEKIHDKLDSISSEQFDTAGMMNTINMDLWIEGDIHKNGSIKSKINPELLTPLKILGIDQATYDSIEERKKAIANTIKEFKNEFKNSPANTIEAGISHIKNKTVKYVEDANKEFDKIRVNVFGDILNKICVYVTTNFIFEDSSYNDEPLKKCGDNNLVLSNGYLNANRVIDESLKIAGGYSICKELIESMKLKVNERCKKANKLLNEKNEEYRRRLSSRSRSTLDAIEKVRKNGMKELIPYVGKLELRYKDIVDDIINKIKKECDFDYNKQEIKNAQPDVENPNWMNRLFNNITGFFMTSEQNAASSIKVECYSWRILHIMTIENIQLEKIKTYLVSEKVIDVDSVYNGLLNSLNSFEQEFYKHRNEAIPNLIKVINEKKDEDKLEIFNKIEHNGLYYIFKNMVYIKKLREPLPNQRSFDPYCPPWARELVNFPEATKIMTKEQFYNTFDENVTSLYNYISENCKSLSDFEYFGRWADILDKLYELAARQCIAKKYK